MIDSIFQDLGLVVFHSLWQVTLVAGLARLVLFMVDKEQAAWRHHICVAALMVSFTLVVLTFLYTRQSSSTEYFSFQIEMAAQDNYVVGTNEVTPMTLIEKVILMANNYSHWVAIAWILGVFIISVKNLVGFYQIKRLRSVGLHTIPVAWQLKFERLVSMAGIGRNVKLKVSALVNNPLTVGTIKPLVLVPIGFFAELSPTQIEAILLHELAHIKRNDYLVNLIQTFITTILFYHPAIWFLSNQIRIERENACDDFAFSRSEEGLSLARALGLLQIRNSKTQNKMAMYLFNRNVSVVKRIQRLVTKNSHIPSERKTIWVPAVIIFLGLILVSFKFTPVLKDQLNGPEGPAQDLSLVVVDTVKHPKPDLPPTPPSVEDVEETEEVAEIEEVTETEEVVEVSTETDLDIEVDPDIRFGDVDVNVYPDIAIEEATSVYVVADPGEVEEISEVEEVEEPQGATYYYETTVTDGGRYEVFPDTTKVKQPKEKQKDKNKVKDKDKASKVKTKEKAWTEEEEQELRQEREKLALERKQLAEERELLIQQQKELMLEREQLEKLRIERDHERSDRERDRSQVRRKAELREAQTRRAEEKLRMVELLALKEMEEAKNQQEQAKAQERLAQIQEQQARIQAQKQEEAKFRQEAMVRLQQREVEKLEQFRKIILEELANDGLLESDARALEIKFPNKKISINGKLIPDQLQLKYKKIFDKFGFEQKDGHTISIGE